MTATLPPLANVVAFRSADPTRTARVRARLEATWPDVAVVGGWLLATRALPKSRPISAECRARGLAFTEGAEQAAGVAGGFEHVASIAREHRYERLRALPGDVGFLWLGDHELIGVRSAAGRVPLYWWAIDGDVAVGSLLTDVAGLMASPPQPDPLLAALWASGQAMFHERRTPVAGVMAAHPGEVLWLGVDGAAAIERWFDPWPEGLPRSRRGDFNAKAAGFGAAIRATVVEELADDGGNLLSFSGGVDSSTLAWLASRAHKPLAALSLIPSAGNAALARERGFIDPLVEAVGIAPHWTRDLTPANRIAWLGGLPDVAMPVLHPVLCLLGEVVAEARMSVLVGGEFCDELCGGSFAVKDWIRTASPMDVTQRLVGGTRQGIKAWARQHTRGEVIEGPYRSLPDIVRGDLHDAFEAWRVERNGQVAASPRVHAHTVELLAANDGAVAQNWEVCSAHGVRRVFPFLTRAVIEAVATCRPAELISPTHKSLSRAAFRGEVPERWLQRADSGSFGPDAPAAFSIPTALPRVLEQVLRPEVLADTEATLGVLPGLLVNELLRFVTSLGNLGNGT